MKIDKEDSVVMFNNRQEKTNHPRFKGYINWKGQQIEFALWESEKDHPTGGKMKYYSGVASPAKEPKNQQVSNEDVAHSRNSYNQQHNQF